MELKGDQIAGAETHLGERVLGKTHIMGEASFDLRALTNEDDMYIEAAMVLERDAVSRVAKAQEMTCRLAITGWRLHTNDGTVIPFETERIARDGPQAVTVAAIRKLPQEVKRELFGEISELKTLSEDEGMRLDFTIPERE
jgi:hypothetical protein